MKLATRLSAHVLTVCLISLVLPWTPARAGAGVWTVRGPEGGPIGGLAFHPTDSQIAFAGGGRSGGLYKTTDAGASWALTTVTNTTVEEVVFDPTNPSTVYAVAESSYVRKSTDGGTTWTALNQGFFTSTRDLAIDPSNTQKLYMTSFGGGVMRSTDGGATWTLSNTGLTSLLGQTIEVDPVTPSTVYVGTLQGLFKSTDSGASWTNVADLGSASVQDFAFDPTDAQVVYAAAGFLRKSIDGGATWTQLSIGGTQLTIDPDNTQVIYAAGFDDVRKTTDGGSTWVSASSGLSGRPAEIAIDPNDSDVLLVGGSPYGVARSVDAGGNWSLRRTGIVTTAILDVVVDPFDPQTLFATGETVPVAKSTDGGQTWALSGSGLSVTGGSALAAASSSPGTVYLTSTGRVFKSVDGGASWSATGSVPNASYFDLAVDPSNADVVYLAGFGTLQKTTNGGASWSTLSFPGAGFVEAVAIDPLATQTVYAAASDKVWKTTDGGATWAAMSSGITGSSVLALAVSPSLSGVVYASSTNGVFRTTNGGASWTAIGGSGLTRALLINPVNNAVVYAAGNNGVFRSLNNAVFGSVTGGLTTSRIEALAGDDRATQSIYAGSFGGGVFDRQIPDERELVSPLNPTLSSNGHTLSAWSGDTTVSAAWTGASDPGSGVDGYSYEWSTDPGTTPNNTKDAEQYTTATTSPALETGDSHYFHLKTVDHAGNWSAPVHLGPFFIDAAAPTGPQVLSGSHATGEWSEDRTIEVSFTGAADADSGLDGFSYEWTTTPGTVPDASKEAEETAAATISPALADGNSHYFHIRAVDNAGNASPAEHLGPFFIDTAAPTNPTFSGTATGMWINSATVDVTLVGGADDGAGLDGFSYDWSGNPSTAPDTIKDLEEDDRTLTSPVLTDGSHYFHVRTADNLGKWSLPAHRGPFLIDRTPATNPNLASSSHVASTWSTDTSIDVAFDGAADALSGVDGFSYQFSQNPSTVPDTTKEAEESATGVTSAALPDGSSHWFHLRTRDVAGNWGPTTHLGPFFIDTAAPGGAALSSRSHPLSTWSDDPTIDVSWTRGSDAGSDINGYSYQWSTVASTVPDTTKDAGESVTGTTSPTLATGSSHYFHLRVRDNAGNWGSAVHLGPFYIDTVVPTDPSLSSVDQAADRWTRSTRITIELAGASDADSGLSGYSYEWSSSSTTIPDAEVDAGASTSSLTSDPLTDGPNYLALRTRDEAGNWSSTVRIGPFLVDTVAPVNPDLVPNGHDLRTWSADPTVAVDLDGAWDARSGIDGYSYSWTTSAASVPDAVVDAEQSAASITSPALASGDSHYLHLRTKDEAGNWSNAVHLGPFFIDADAPNATSLDALNAFQRTRGFSLSWAPVEDAHSGTAGYLVERSSARYNADFGAPQTHETAATKLGIAGVLGTSYCSSVRVEDVAGNRSAASDVGCTAIPLAAGSLVHSSGWVKKTGTGYFENAYSTSKKRGATLTLGGLTDASQIALVATKCPGCGSVDVFLGAVKLNSAPISLQGSTTKKKVVIPVATFAAPSSGTLKIKVTTANKTVILEGVGVLKTR